MPRVLIIAYNFPPIANVSAHRPAKYAKYLPKFGWEPIVLTRPGDPLHPVDESLGRGIDPAIVVERVSEPSLRHVFGAFVKLGLAGAVRRLQRWVSMPDDQYGWIASAYRHGKSLIEKHRPDAVLCSCVPLSSAIAGALLRGATHVPLVLDFHNEWTRNMYFDPPTAMHERMQARLEAWVVNRADAVVTLNPMHTEDYAARFPGRFVTTIHNGFEAEDYAGASPPPPARGRPVVFAYAGAIYGFQSPVPVIRALDSLIEGGSLRAEEVEVRILGDPFRSITLSERSPAGALAKAGSESKGYGEESRACPVKVIRDVPHADLPRHLAKADVCFLALEDPAARQLPAKLYEYMAARRPTLAVVPPDGAAARLLGECRAGVVVAPEDEAGLRKALLEAVRSAREGSPAVPTAEAIAPFRRERLVEQMSRVLEMTMNKRR